MTDSLFARHLKRAFAVPVLTLIAIALIFGYIILQLQTSAAQVDHSDLVIAHANLLGRLIVDQETGLRGNTAYHDPAFLEPYHRAAPEIAREFTTLLTLVSDNGSQVEQLGRIRTAYSEWILSAEMELRGVKDGGAAAQRKLVMDGIRRDLDLFVEAETVLRARRASAASRYTRIVLWATFAAIVLGGLLIGDYSRRSLRELVHAYREQLALVEARSSEAVASEAWLRTTMRSIGDAVIACDERGRIIFMNMVAERLTGWLGEEARGRSLHEVFRIVNETSRALVESPVDKVRRLGIVVGLANHTILIRRDATEIHIDDSGAPITDDHGKLTGIVLIFRDITERRQAETALAKADKLASIGRLSAAMAHEVNNPLEALTNLIYLARMEVTQPEVRQNLDLAEQELGRIAHITRQSLGFYRDSSTMAMFSVASMVNQTVTFYLARASIRSVALKTDLRSDIELLGSASELRQVMSNLLSNALDACEAGASIWVTLRKDRDRRTGETGARITIADSGCGIAARKLAAIFEPFYTTKGSTGTGLGLWVTRQLIEKHGGTIRVRSRNEGTHKGTIFRIFLPAVHAEISAASAMTGEGLI